MLRNPSLARRACATLPTPKISDTDLGARNAAASLAPRIVKPRGLSRSDAILARNLLAASPIDTVMPSSRSTCSEKRASDLAGGMPCSRSVPERSMKASSIDTGSTSGVSSRMRARTPLPTSAYLSMRGRTIVACGQSRLASNIGIAERTPKVRAT